MGGKAMGVELGQMGRCMDCEGPSFKLQWGKGEAEAGAAIVIVRFARKLLGV